ncbi:hypothetical protein PSY19_23880, partial [Shigella flexneri]|nr:hypothetical protein [Shigella flexneri]
MCITFSHNIKQINSLKNEFICLILWEKVMHVGEEAYSHNIKQINSLKNERFFNEFICLILWEYASSPTCI